MFDRVVDDVEERPRQQLEVALNLMAVATGFDRQRERRGRQ